MLCRNAFRYFISQFAIIAISILYNSILNNSYIFFVLYWAEILSVILYRRCNYFFNMRFKRYDIVLDTNNCIHMVQGMYGDKVIVHPKYVPNGTWKILNNYYERISNPLDSHRTNSMEVANLQPFGNRDYSIEEQHISKCFTIDSYKITPTDNILKSTKKMLDELFIFIPKEKVGITGSILLGSQNPKYSDIDLVVDYKFYESICDFIRKSSGVKLRTQRQWEDFYEEFNLKCALNKQEFAKHMLFKPHQFLYEGYPVSIFFSNSNEYELEKYTNEKQNIDVMLRVEDASHAMTLPAYYTAVSDRNEVWDIICYERAFISQAEKGENIQIKGFSKKKKIYIRSNNKDIIRKC